MHHWKLEDAKNRFSEVVRRALAHEPQRVTRRGSDAVVVVSAEDYDRLTAPQEDLVSFLQRSPLAPASVEELELSRQRDVGRYVNLD